ncbi:alpha/beta hydrolase [Compostimonas suwonensis]|uniref:Alpha-beta hydrolase superfamily lysophospholipase n=1 Tax=Compostimonas suwonensis TaxID=1048394 RepID=A0A2M9BTV1_9MICO|nr:alpha/beta hydrolase [Compostimonas suwonensis]PJJ61370.1 alpha-beta hydrolase superfamily lysophospholipase [Compostimonas suwonensis]
MNTTQATPVIFIHGLWMHSSSWDNWVELFRANGFDAQAPGWPGDSATVAESNANPEAIAGVGIDQVVEHYAGVIRSLGSKPVLIGHSFGGLIAQKLLGMGLAVAAVAIDPAQIKGVLPLPFVQLKNALPVLGNPANRKRAVSQTPKRFHGGFANAVSEKESNELFARYAIPAPGRPLFEAATANFSSKSPAAVNVHAVRGPLLIIGGGQDHTVPEVTSRAAFALYAKAPTVNEYRVFDDRGHSLVIDHGWREVADAALDFLARNGVVGQTREAQPAQAARLGQTARIGESAEV